MEQLLTIGEFAARCGLSRSALRFYDHHDLLAPRLVDEDTGYRYYAVEQLRQAALVRRLRLAELPVDGVRRYLVAGPVEQRTMLDAHLASFRARASAVETVVDGLTRELVTPRSCTVAASRFADALAQVSFAIADPAVRAELGAVWVETKEDSLRLVATDSYRMAVRDLVPQQIGEDVRGVIDAAHAAALVTQLTGAERLTLSQDPDGTIHAQTDGVPTTVGHAGTGFPDYERILTELPAGDRIALPREAVADALRELLPGATSLSLEFEPTRLVLRTPDHRAAIAGTWSGRAMRIFMDARFFADAVEATLGPDLIVEASDPLHPIALRSADTGTFSVLTMPVRPPDRA